MNKFDESDPYADLPDGEFVETRQVILDLLTRMFREGSSKLSSKEMNKIFIDDAVAEIARIWLIK